MNCKITSKLVQERKVKIYSAGTYLPDEIVKSDDLFTEIKSDVNYNIPIDWMSSVMGIKERRVSKDTTLPSELAIPAAFEAIDSCPEINPDRIDLVIFCGIERDQPEPATAHRIQNALGLNAKHVFDISNACYGFVDGIEIASNFIKSGAIEYALIVTGEVPTKILRTVTKILKNGVNIKEARNLIGGLSVGDAGGAVIVGESHDNTTGFELFNTVADSKHIEKCIYKFNEDGSFDGQMLMGPITNAIVQHHKMLIDDTLLKLGWEEFDWMLSHQMGQRPFDKISGLHGVRPNRMIKTFDKLGNITSATFPVNFKKLSKNGKVSRGDRIGGCFAGSGLAIGQLGYTF